MQERGKNTHYSEQRGHAERGIANRFRQAFGYKPVTVAAELVFLQRRFMKRIPRTGKG